MRVDVTPEKVLELLCDGQNLTDIRHQLAVSRQTVHRHTLTLRKRFSVQNYIQIAVKAILSGQAQVSQRLIQSWRDNAKSNSCSCSRASTHSASPIFNKISD